jgi:hypothetical protein
MNLFDDSVRYLNIILNDEKFDGIFEELIEGFDEFRAITFVSSPKAFFNFAKNFKKTILIIGIEDNDILKNFVHQINPDSNIDFFKDLDMDTLEKISRADIEVRYASLGKMIHSKIFIFKGKQVQRLMIGSANLTESALSNKKQFEELIVYDENYNPKLFDIFEKRFDEIYKQTIDYVPERYKKSKDINVNIVTVDDKFDILSELIEKQRIFGISSDALKELIPKFDENGINIDLENREFNVVKDLFDKTTKRSKDGVIFISKSELSKKKPLFLETFNPPIKGEEISPRNGVLFNSTDGLLYKSDKTVYSKKIDDEKSIVFFLDKIERFVEAYEIFTIGNDEEKLITQKRVFEAILYTFVSPYIWKLRELHVQEKGSESVRSDIPIFLVIAGRSYTGKTHILEFLSVMTNQRYYTFEKEANHTNIRNYLYSKEVFPLLIDEVKKQYFSSEADVPSKGEGFIKTLVNSLKGTHPCVISTTNTKFDVGSQIVRRIYYLEMKTTFDKSKRQEMDDYYSQTIQDLNDELLRDFSFRMTQKLDEDFSTNYDFLKTGREIFKEYFMKGKKPIPKWFNDEMLNDYTLKSKGIWKSLFETKRDGFVVGDSDISVDTQKVFSDRYEKENAKNFLDPSIVKEDSVVLILDKQRFFEFIEYKDNLIDKVRRFIKRP